MAFKVEKNPEHQNGDRILYLEKVSSGYKSLVRKKGFIVMNKVEKQIRNNIDE